MTNPLTVGSLRTGPETVVRLVGEVDCSTVPLLRAAFDQAPREAAHHVLVDLSGTTFMDGAGLNALLQARRDWGNRLRLYRPPASLRRILQALEMEDAFTIDDAVDTMDAMDTVDKGPWPPGFGRGTRRAFIPAVSSVDRSRR